MPTSFFDDEKILDDIIQQGDIIINVVPIDKQAPKGRLILPKVRTIRNILDNKAISLVVSENELANTLGILNQKPKLVITDSQVFNTVAKIMPNDILLTSYSIIFARLKGDLQLFIEGVKQIPNLQSEDKILICESCTHHASCDDIGRVKIPNLLMKTTGKNLRFDYYNGHDFPTNIKEYSLIVHCGGCMTNKKEVLSRMLLAKDANVPITNYGIAIAACFGILDRAVDGLLND